VASPARRRNPGRSWPGADFTTDMVVGPRLTHCGPSPKLVGRSMNGSKRASAMPQSPATGEPSPPSEQFQFNSHRFRPKDGCRPHYDCDDVECHPHRDCDDESAVDCASLVGPLSTPKPNWG
jgi:hypothetical protein